MCVYLHFLNNTYLSLARVLAASSIVLHHPQELRFSIVDICSLVLAFVQFLLLCISEQWIPSRLTKFAWFSFFYHGITW